MTLASLQTTEARWAAEDAAKAWKEHKGHCPGCDLATRRRQWDALCWKGRELRTEGGRTERALKRARELDRQPCPDQAPLF